MSEDLLLSPNAFVLDLDQTLVDSTKALSQRKLRQWEQVYRLIPQFRLYPGVRELLDTLKSFPVAIVTSSPRPYAERVLGHFCIVPDVLVCFHDTRNRKPYPDPVELALARLTQTSKWSGRITCIWGVGDHPNDIESARSAGIVPIGAEWGSDDISQLRAARPHVSFVAPEDLLAHISTVGTRSANAWADFGPVA